ncbi:response regulator [Nitrospirillum amazonense]|uniref:Response regulator receiver domain-containing protein n=1 Tax=Nitrospirillum amazonense TaxID=28077 RepID=A0A560K8W6_9PROT|nr:response regulator [Nitrospirillum amazonense]MDG3441851.1 response regulator [Nitrospirillum amazonense]TWB79656.1 response regulator receiver domain-containing protein [Nitrospirillum amazonense]
MAESLNRILYVDDEPDIRAIVELSLRHVGGFDVQMAESGARALEILDGWTPQLILLDAMMPGMDGPATLAAIRQRPALAGVPIAFMTAKVQPSEVARFKELGAVGVVAKPFDPMSLPNTVRELWGGAGPT